MNDLKLDYECKVENQVGSANSKILPCFELINYLKGLSICKLKTIITVFTYLRITFFRQF